MYVYISLGYRTKLDAGVTSVMLDIGCHFIGVLIVSEIIPVATPKTFL